MITTEDGVIRKSVFYDNVRDFQDLNPVNTSMLETLTSADRELFPVLNNGVTVVAQRVQPVADDFTIEDFQIVNGCQTSHVLFKARDDLNDKVLIPLRLIVTEDELVAAKVTKATNNQTPVPEGDLQALTDFQKELEAHYRGYGDKQRLYYERRSRQYASDTSVVETRVVTPLVQIRAFAAMFLDEPHLASRYYRLLYERVPSDIFNANHKYEPYYTSAFAWYRLDVAFRLKRLDAALRPARYLLLDVFKHLALPSEPVPSLNSPAIAKYCGKLNAALMQEQDAQGYFAAAGDYILQAADGVITRDKLKRERLTKDALELAINGASAASRYVPPGVGPGPASRKHAPSVCRLPSAHLVLRLTHCTACRVRVTPEQCSISTSG